MPSRGRVTLPTELLHRIVIFAILQHLDDLIAGPLCIPVVDEHGIPDYYDEDDDDYGSDNYDSDYDAEGLEIVEEQDVALNAFNPVTALLLTSFQVRGLTMKSLADVLGIALMEGGNGKRCAIELSDTSHWSY